MAGKRRRFVTSPFRKLTLTDSDIERVREIAHQLVTHGIAEYERHVVGDREIDDFRWKLVKQKDQLCIYTERKDAECDAIPTFDMGGLSLGDTSGFDANTMPTVLSTGTVPGNLDDYMLGILNPTLGDMAIKASYTKDLQSGAVLATLVEPTTGDPFHSLVLKWTEVDVPLRHTKLVRNRDFVYLEATGISSMQNGERVGYYLAHSIHFPQTCELEGRIRGNWSNCGIFRQIHENAVEVYSVGIADPGGEMSGSTWITAIMDNIQAPRRYVHCGQMKKLAWLLHKRYSFPSEDKKPSPPDIATSSSGCERCGKANGSRKLLFGGGGRRRHVCKICRRGVCASCIMEQKLNFLTRDEHVVQQNAGVCTDCIRDAAQLSAADVIRDQINTIDRNRRLVSDANSERSTSSSIFE